jgi:hypothetical protein
MQMLLRTIDIELFEIGVAIEELLMIGDAVIFNPIVRTNKAIGQAAHVSLPIADEEVEVVRSIARGSRRFTCHCTG